MATNTIKIRSGECAILPSNAIIVSAMTFATNPSVTSPDCQQLALDVEDALVEIVDSYIKISDSNGGRRNSTSNYQNVVSLRACYNNICYNVPSIDMDNSSQSDWQSVLNLTNSPFANLIKVTSTSLVGDGANFNTGPAAGNTLTINVKGPKTLIEGLTLDFSYNQGTSQSNIVSYKFGND